MEFVGWCVYILECSDGSYYTGITNNITSRLKTHRSGKGSKYVRSRLPVVLIYLEKRNDISDAGCREREIKKLKKKQKQELINNKLYNML